MSTRTPPSVGLLLALASVLALGATAAQEDLYGPQAPTDVAYVRALNALEPGGLGVRVADGALEVLEFAGATAYVRVAPGSVRVDLGGEALEIEAELGAFLTVVARPKGALVIADTPLVDSSRGLLALYNLLETPALDLLTADGTIVLEAVPPGSQAAIAVAEAEVGLQVVAEDGTTVALEPQLYERGVAHALIVVPGDGGIVVGYAASRLDH